MSLEDDITRILNGTYEPMPKVECDERCHSVAFDEEAAKGMSADEVRKRWPRVWVNCSVCGFSGVSYASFAHYVAGDW